MLNVKQCLEPFSSNGVSSVDDEPQMWGYLFVKGANSNSCLLIRTLRQKYSAVSTKNGALYSAQRTKNRASGELYPDYSFSALRARNLGRQGIQLGESNALAKRPRRHR